MNHQDLADARIAWSITDIAHIADPFTHEHAGRMERMILEALKNARQLPPAGHIMDEHGTIIRVLGKLPVTADKCIVGHGSKVYYNEEPYEESDQTLSDRAFFLIKGIDSNAAVCGHWIKISQCYGSQEAAKKAGEA
jgi:hypothetical protein